MFWYNHPLFERNTSFRPSFLFVSLSKDMIPPGLINLAEDVIVYQSTSPGTFSVVVSAEMAAINWFLEHLLDHSHSQVPRKCNVKDVLNQMWWSMDPKTHAQFVQFLRVQHDHNHGFYFFCWLAIEPLLPKSSFIKHSNSTSTTMEKHHHTTRQLLKKEIRNGEAAGESRNTQPDDGQPENGTATHAMQTNRFHNS